MAIANYKPIAQLSSKEKEISYTTVSGKVVDANTKAPIVFVNVSITDTKIGTITNSNGDFELKIPNNLTKAALNFTHLGYKTETTTAASFASEKNSTVALKEENFMLDEVIIRDITPTEIIENAIKNRSKNYKTSPEMQSAFYRESLKRNSSYVGITEAVLSVYKSAYDNPSENDRVKIIKARKGVDISRMDTLIFKLSGGPVTSYLLDIVKKPENLFTEKMLEKYVFTLKNYTKIDNLLCYIIDFKEISNDEEAIYSGTVFVSVENFAIVGAEFQISPDQLKIAANYLISKKPSSYKIDLQSANYLVSYKFINTEWHLSHVRSNMVFKVKKRHQLFNNYYSSLFEMAVTNYSDEPIVKHKFRESTKIYDVLNDKVSYFEDRQFWGDYNIIKPNESIESAIKKLNKRLTKQIK